MPGGKGYLNSLTNILNHVRVERPTERQFIEWMMVEYGLKNERTAKGIFRMIKNFGLLKVEYGRLSLTDLSINFLKSGDRKIILKALCDNVVGLKDILWWLHKRIMSDDEIFQKLNDEYNLNWKTMRGAFYRRLRWLVELNCVKKIDKKYVLTDFGKKFVEEILLTAKPEPAMSPIKQFEEKLRKYVKKVLRNIERRPNMSEADTKSVIIEPLLELLGWDVRDISEVEREFLVPGGKYGEHVDIALKVHGKPALFIEAKAVRVDLEDKMAQQVINYAIMGNVEWCMLTNGRELRLYNAFWRVKGIKERLFMRLKLEDYVKNIDRLMLLSKESLKTGKLTEEGMQVYVGKLTSLWLRENEEKIVEEVLKMDPAVPKEKIKEAIRHIISHVS